MAVLGVGAKLRAPRLDFELTTACDHRCRHCYNVWNAREGDAQAGYPKANLDRERFLALIDKAVAETGARHITFTGGEPLLHPHALDLIARGCERVPSVQLITNGAHVPPEVARRLGELGVRSVQLTLLAGAREHHDELKGAESFDDTVRAALDLRDAGVGVQACFVATRANWRELAGVMELCFALKIGALSYNRMSPAGGAIHQVERLLPTPEQLEHNLATAERLGRRWQIRVSTAMPIPPCLVRIDRYRWIKFGFCSVGSGAPNLTIDPNGNVRSCNLSSHVMGNLLEQSWKRIAASHYFHGFRRRLAEPCRACAYAKTCQGGCKESAFAVFGDLRHPEPLLHLALSRDTARQTGV